MVSIATNKYGKLLQDKRTTERKRGICGGKKDESLEKIKGRKTKIERKTKRQKERKKVRLK